MREIDNRPVIVTGEERKHPAVRTLARACVALARLRLEREAAGEPDKAEEAATGQPAEREEGAANG